MSIEVPEVAEVRKLLEELDEKALIARLDSFVTLNEGLESKRGKEFIEVSILGFLEGILTALGMKYPESQEVEELLGKVGEKRQKVDELFKKPAMQNLK